MTCVSKRPSGLGTSQAHQGYQEPLYYTLYITMYPGSNKHSPVVYISTGDESNWVGTETPVPVLRLNPTRDYSARAAFKPQLGTTQPVLRFNPSSGLQPSSIARTKPLITKSWVGGWCVSSGVYEAVGTGLVGLMWA